METPRGKVSYSKSRIQAATELVFSECYQRSEGPEKGSEQLSWSQNTKAEGNGGWGWSVSIPEERTACAKSEAVHAGLFSRLASECVTAPHPGPGTQESLRKAGSPCFIQGAVSPSSTVPGRDRPRMAECWLTPDTRIYLSKIPCGASDRWLQAEIQPHQETTKEAYQNCLALTCDSTPNPLSGPGESIYSHLLKHQSEATPCIHYP